MIIRINTSFWFLMDNSSRQTLRGMRCSLWVVRGCFQFCYLYSSWDSFFSTTPHPHFLSSFALVHTKNIHFLHSPSTVLHHLVTSADKWGQKAISLTCKFNIAQRLGKMINVWQVTKCYPANSRRYKAEPSDSLSSLWIIVTFQDQPVFSIKNWESTGHGLGNIYRVGGVGEQKAWIFFFLYWYTSHLLLLLQQGEGK